MHSTQVPLSRNAEGFEQVLKRRKSQRNPTLPNSNRDIKTNNSFESLSHDEEGKDNSLHHETNLEANPKDDYD
jgi:hypothetical protein